MGKYCTFFVFFFVYGCGTRDIPPGDPGNGGLILPDYFQALVVVDSIEGRAREITVSDQGDLYVKTKRSGKGNVVGLRDLDGDGKADVVEHFAKLKATSRGGLRAGVEIYNGYLYFSTELAVYRMKLSPGTLVPQGEIQVVVQDDHEHGRHEHIARPFGAQ